MKDTQRIRERWMQVVRGRFLPRIFALYTTCMVQLCIHIVYIRTWAWEASNVHVRGMENKTRRRKWKKYIWLTTTTTTKPKTWKKRFEWNLPNTTPNAPYCLGFEFAEYTDVCLCTLHGMLSNSLCAYKRALGFFFLTCIKRKALLSFTP